MTSHGLWMTNCTAKVVDKEYLRCAHSIEDPFWQVIESMLPWKRCIQGAQPRRLVGYLIMIQTSIRAWHFSVNTQQMFEQPSNKCGLGNSHALYFLCLLGVSKRGQSDYLSETLFSYVETRVICHLQAGRLFSEDHSDFSQYWLWQSVRIQGDYVFEVSKTLCWCFITVDSAVQIKSENIPELTLDCHSCPIPDVTTFFQCLLVIFEEKWLQSRQSS